MLCMIPCEQCVHGVPTNAQGPTHSEDCKRRSVHVDAVDFVSRETKDEHGEDSLSDLEAPERLRQLDDVVVRHA